MMYSNGRIFKSKPWDLNFDDISDGTEESVIGELEEVDMGCEEELEMVIGERVVDGRPRNWKHFGRFLRKIKKRTTKEEKDKDNT